MKCVLSSKIDKIWIIDHSPASHPEYRLPDDDRIEYVKRRNSGYGSGNNYAIERSISRGYKYHIVLNPDVYWEDDVVGKLAEFMDANPDVAQAMPRVYYPSGKMQYQARLLPTPADLFFRRVCRRINSKRHVEEYEMRHAPMDKVLDVPFLSGCFMFLRNDVLKVTGGFDERFFMYHEDMDLTRRLHKEHRTVYFPDVWIYHNLERASSKSFKLFLTHIASMWRYFNKWGWFHDRERNRMNRKAIEDASRLKR